MRIISYSALKERSRCAIEPLLPIALVENLEKIGWFNIDSDLQVVLPRLRFDKLILDIGANEGNWTRVFRRYAKNVVAFEPLEENVNALRRKVKNTVEIHQVALGAENGAMPLFIPYRAGGAVGTRASLDETANPGFELREVSIRVVTLELYEFRNVGVIKIDVEGTELDVLKGGVDTINREQPIMLIEIEERHHSGRFWDVIRWIEERNYEIFFICNRAVRPIVEFDLKTHQDVRNLKDPSSEQSGIYANNFLCVPKLALSRH